MWVCLQPICGPERSDPCVSKGVAAGIGAWDTAVSQEGRLEREDSWDPQEMGSGSVYVCARETQVSICVLLESWG